MAGTRIDRTPGRRLPVGAEALGNGVHFRVWAPDHRRLDLVLLEDGGERLVELGREDEGYFSGFVAGPGPGARYRYRTVGAQHDWPDPASRFQPEGPHGPSEVVDPAAFEWSDAGWAGARLPGQVFYELHVGTFTPEGSFAAAAKELATLAETGITAVELMPVAEFAGPFGWGYDGVAFFAPCHRYGRPDDLRRFVDRAHQLGLAVLLDFVCNHLGPEGGYLNCYARDYFSRSHRTDWGDAFNFDGARSAPVREYFLACAAHWVGEYHVDGFRIDATQDIHDDSREHFLAALVRHARRAAGGRDILLVAENEPQHTRLVRPPAQGGYGLDALWNDDFHHSARVALTGLREAYYSDHRGAPQEFVSAAKRGYLFQGQWYAHQGKRRGTPTAGLAPAAFVNYLENHDQVANSGSGERLHRLAAPGSWRALTALLLLMPGTPLLFQGQEFGSSRPFLYFADPDGKLRTGVNRGRAEFLAQFPSLATPEMQERLACPSARETFERCRLDPAERAGNTAARALHRDLLRLRREDRVFRAQGAGLDGAVLAQQAFVLRFFGEAGDDRLLLVNLGAELRLESVPEPLLAPPPAARCWRPLWSSEDPRYGGSGTPPLDTGPWRIPARAAVVLAPGGD